MKNFPKNTLLLHIVWVEFWHIVSPAKTQMLSELLRYQHPFGGHNAAAFLRYAFPKLLVMKDLAPYSNSVAYSRNIIPPCRWLNVVTTGGGSPFMANANDGVVSVKSQRCVKPTDELLLATNHFEVVQHSTVINAINSIVKGTVL
jgi:alpha/beta superfamily hydrolase